MEIDNSLLEEYKQYNWVNVSKGNWSFLSCTDFIVSYTKNLIIEGKNPFNHPVQVCLGEKSELWYLQSELDDFGQRIKHINTAEKINQLVENVQRTGSEALNFIRSHKAKDFDSKAYLELWKKINDYYQYHLVVKYLVEYLTQENIEKYSEILKNLRVQFGEPIFNESEILAKQIIELIADKNNLDKNLLAYLTRDELNFYFDQKILPKIEKLEERYKKSLIIGTPDGYAYLTGEEADMIEAFLYHDDVNSVDKIIGNSAFKGLAVGIARVIQDPKSVSIFNEGDILVTGMTHVDYLPLVQKSAAIVTDAGGILSHAAIIARELKKPCVIGTKNGTKIIKDGQRIEVDADKGVIRILNK